MKAVINSGMEQCHKCRIPIGLLISEKLRPLVQIQRHLLALFIGTMSQQQHFNHPITFRMNVVQLQ